MASYKSRKTEEYNVTGRLLDYISFAYNSWDSVLQLFRPMENSSACHI